MLKPIIILAMLWVAVVAFVRHVVAPYLAWRPGGGAMTGLLWYVVRGYVRLMHRPTYAGTDLLPASDRDHDGLIVVANHTGAIDPLAIQARCAFAIRWMMASEMMSPELDWLWHHQRTIPVDRNGRDTGPLREAIRHVRGGGAIGIFPEGRITTPPREIRPFLTGVGLLIAKTRAPVLLVWVSGTPDTNRLGEALATRSQARVVFIDRIEFDDFSDPPAMTEHLRHRIAEASGWPLNDESLPPGGPGESFTAA